MDTGRIMIVMSLLLIMVTRIIHPVRATGPVLLTGLDLRSAAVPQHRNRYPIY